MTARDLVGTGSAIGCAVYGSWLLSVGIRAILQATARRREPAQNMTGPSAEPSPALNRTK